MSESKPNGVSSAEEFRSAAMAERYKRSEMVQLPSGLWARLVKPTAWQVFLATGMLPQSVAARISPAPEGTPSVADAYAISRNVGDLVRFVFVEPAVPDDARPGVDIPCSDVEWAVRWARGEVTPAGQDLAEKFPGQPADAAGPASA